MMRIPFYLFSFLCLSLHSLANPPPLDIQGTLFSVNHNNREIHYYFYSSIVTYHDDVQTIFTEKQLAGLVKQAYDEADARRKEHLAATEENQPLSGMNMLVVGKQAIFSSQLRIDRNPSQGAAPRFFYDVLPSSAPLRQQLLECWAGQPHQTNRNCGEIVGMQLWYLANPDKQWATELGALTGHWSGAHKSVIDPCGASLPNRGCKQFASRYGIAWLQKKYQAHEIQESTVTPQEIDHIPSLWCDNGEPIPRPVTPSPIPQQPPSPAQPPPDLRDQSPDYDYESGDDEMWRAIDAILDESKKKE